MWTCRPRSIRSPSPDGQCCCGAARRSRQSCQPRLPRAAGEGRRATPTLPMCVKVLSLPDDRELPARTPKWLAQKMQQKRDGLPTPGSFWLSLQPDCDSMRLDDARSFPMAPLIKVEESEARAGSKFDLVALDPDEGKPLYFRTSTRPYQLRMISFAPSESVIRATNDSPGPLLTDGDGVTWLWIAQLRFAHALRLANSLGGAMARVGLDESEWLRRHSRSSD